MLNKISQITGLRFSETDLIARAMLQRIAAALPEGCTEESADFEKQVLKAEKAVDADGIRIFAQMTKTVTAEPAVRVLKIKSSKKGIRSSIPAANGIRYAFGPIWNDSIIKGTGIAFTEVARPKLIHHANILGIKYKESITSEKLAKLVAPHLV